MGIEALERRLIAPVERGDEVVGELRICLGFRFFLEVVDGGTFFP